MNMLKTSLRIWSLRCRRFGTYYLRARLISTERDVPMCNEFCHRRLHCLLNANLHARKSENSETTISVGSDGEKSISQWWIDYKKRKSFKERCVSRVSRALKCSEQRSSYIIDTDTLTFMDKIDATLDIIEYLVQHGITVEGIATNIAILRLSKSDIEFRIGHMKRWGIDERYYTEFLTVFKLPTADFILISNQLIREKSGNVPDGNRVIHFAKLLGVSIESVTRAFVRCRQLYNYNFDKIKASLQCYLDYGVDPEYILKDIAGLRADTESIKLRLAPPFEKGLGPLRPYLVMCSNYTYLRKCRELQEQVNLYAPYENRKEYITGKIFSQKHHMSDHKKKKMLAFFDTVETKKLISVLQFLLEKNYSADQICTNFYLFCFDVEILEERYATFQRVGIRSPSCKMLLMTKHAFEQFTKRQVFHNNEAKQIMADMGPLMSQEIDESKTAVKNEE